MNIPRIRAGGQVRRFHTIPTIGHQTVAEHSWGVAILILVLNPLASTELLRAALLHDVPEADTGDMPAQVKWANPMLAHELEEVEQTVMEELDIVPLLTPAERLFLKAADKLDGMWTCYEQRCLGNKNMEIIFGRWLMSLDALLASALLHETLDKEQRHRIHECKDEITTLWKELTHGES